MTALKRKREEIPGPHKSPRVEDEDQMMEGDQDSEDSGEMSAMDEDEAQGEWGGITGSNEAVPPEGVHTGKKSKLPSTGEELRAIKDASDLFKSSSFKLQIDVLLPNVRPKASRVPPLERFLFALHSFLKEIPSVAPQHPLEAARKLLKKGVAVPYSLPLPTEETNWKVAFEPPSDITLVGSWANKVSVKPKDGNKFGVDLAVEMPNSLFQEKDYLNGRFFHKRAFYLATLAAAIQKSKMLDIDVSYESLQGDTRLTKLVLTPKPNDSVNNFTKIHAKVCVLPILSTNSPIPLHRLSPSHSNIRLNVATNITNDDTKAAAHHPTPSYNTALLRTLAPKFQLLSVHELQNDCPAFSDALTLLRIWANQRGYSEGTRMCVRGFEGAGPWWWSILALLLNGEERRPGATKANKRKSVGKGLSSYQLFKAALEFLAKHDFEKEHVFVRSPEGHRYPPEEYSSGTEALFVDSASLTNLLAGVPLGSLELLRYDARQTLDTLNQASFSGDPFGGVFLKDCRDLPTRFDIILQVNLTSAKPRNASAHSTIDFGSPANALLASINSILRLGLGDRSRAVTILHPSSTPRSLSQAHPSSPDIIFIGLIHDPHHAFRLVDHGPAANAEDEIAVQNFRDLWGDKAELRRFKDGRILESVVWEVTTADERAHVPSMVVRHLLKRHFSIQDGDVETWQASFDALLRLPPSVSREYMASGVSTGFKGALTAFDNLVKAVKKLDDDLPLSLLTVSPISEMLRYTSVFSPIPLTSSLASLLPPNARYLAPIEIILEFEKSSKWPDDIKAVQAIKLAFFERIASTLMNSVPGLTAKVVVGDGVHGSLILDKACMEIVTPEGWAFSASIWHDREVNLLDQVIGGETSTLPHIVSKKEKKRSAEYYEALEAKEFYMRRFIHAPRHHRAIATLAHHYSAFPGTVRLVKRWLASHWILHGHISNEVIELICASFFIDSGRTVTSDTDTEKTMQHLVPTSKERGFSCVIHFLKEWKWEEGLFVPLYGAAAAPASESLPSTSTRSGNASVWKVSTELDKDGHVWTHQGPDLVVAHRVHALANATWNCLQGIEQGQLNVQSIFIHPTDDYDILVKLDPSVLPRYFHNVNADTTLLTKRGKYANKTQGDETVGLMPGFDPAQLLFNDLQRVYTDTLKLFYDPFGGDSIGAVWDPSLKEARPFRVLGGFSSLPVKKDKAKDKGMVVLNQSAIISELERLGYGLLKKITLHA
ncbi:Nrap protein [Pholiota conissans]|uniref:U3 small nucleolar RNA-associated protein 22 n=1 Tax=Pholiota conissans TaxID=109636 RepID=A0A9P6CQL8_9AGAR|nr:Nrap protein [Pholiota conissans]